MSQFNEPWERIRVQYGYPLLIDEVDATPEQMVRIVACVNACKGISTDQLVAVRNFGIVGAQTTDKLALIKQRDELLTAMIEARQSLQFANDSPGSGISDTIWMMHRNETLFDFMDAAIISAQGVKPVVQDSLITETMAIVFYPAGSLGEEVQS